MLLNLSIVLILTEVFYIAAQTESAEPDIQRPSQSNKAHHVFPYTMDDSFVTEKLEWKSYRQDHPPYVTLYEAPTSNVFFYIFPPKYCNAVWLCFARKLNASTASGDKFFAFDVAGACDESLRFHPLEQLVYVTHLENANTEQEKRVVSNHPYWSSQVEIVYTTDEAGNRMYHFTPFAGDFDGEDVSKAKRGNTLKLNMFQDTLLLFTSSPYCNAKLIRPLAGPLEGRKVLFWGKDEQKILRQAPTDQAHPSMYFLTGSKQGSHVRENLWKDSPATAFDPPSRKTMKPDMDCCPPTWEFEGFVMEGEWIVVPKITYLKYTFYKHGWVICQKDAKYPIQQLQSILLETGRSCEWVRICFDTLSSKKMCGDDASTLAFIFIHGIMIPTDGDEARQLGLSYKDLDPIRINFIRGQKGIEVGYAFGDHISPGIRELMQLSIYDGEDPTQLQLTLVRAPNCEARLLNDLAAANIRYGEEYDRQCLSISSCECLNAA